MRRKSVMITIMYIIGIIWGIYFNKNISFFLAFFILIIIITIKNRYIKLLLIIMAISSIYTYKVKEDYENRYKNVNDIHLVGTILEKNVKEYNIKYVIKIESANNCIKFKNTKLIVYAKKDTIELNYGNKIELYGNFKNAEKNKNYKGFNYREYLKTKKIYGIVEANKIELKSKNDINVYQKCIHNLYEKIKENTYKILPKETASICNAIIIGDKSNVEDNVIQNFSDSNLAHILAVSGLHMSYIIMIISYILKRTSKNKKNVILVIIAIFFCNLVGNSESIIRATVMVVIYIISNIIHRKSDSITSMCIACLIILINNPYSIKSISFLLSFGGTLGIIVLYKDVINTIDNIYINNSNIFKYIKESLAISISANIIIIPIMIIFYNKLSLIFIISNFLANILLICIMPLIIICVLIAFSSIKLAKIISILLNFFLKLLLNISEITAKIKILNFTVCTPSIITIIFYYIIIILFHIKCNSNKKQKKLIKKIIKASIFIYILIFITSKILLSINKNLNIYFINVDQGDSTLVTTIKNKKILIDGGGTEKGEDYVGKNILLPYLLDRKIKTLDYVIISHFDSDHCKGILYVMQNLKVYNVIIGKQYESNENYKEFIKIVSEKKINLKIVESGQRINIEKNLYIDIIWPSSSNIIHENNINNNSLVCKLVYKKFSIMFTGDIEEIGEKAIVEKYKNNLNILNSTILKVAHHGSKTSSKQEFLKLVKPQYALIGVGKDNKFGHPSDITIKNLKMINAKIYRTDEMGEITIKTNGTNVIIKEQS